jgi:hypothetical protein
MKKTYVVAIIVLAGLSAIILTFAFWAFQPEKKLDILILDKTVVDNTYRKHASFTWVLRNHKIVHPDGHLYDLKDYYGFVPSKSDNKQDYTVRSVRLLEVLDKSDKLDMVYYTDSYGVFSNDLSDTATHVKPYLIYGGLNQNDYLLLREMKRRKKLIVTEFHLLGSPTSELIREKTQLLFDFKYTGWTGCYFKSLKNTPENEIPLWIVNAYQKNYQKTWSFTNPGVVIVNENGNIVVLEQSLQLNSSLPVILTTDKAQKEYNLPPVQKYGSWFDIVQTSRKNQIRAYFKLDVNKEGKRLLDENKLPASFPAIIEHSNDYKFYYFSGDFSDHRPTRSLAYLKIIPSMMQKIRTGSKGTSNEFFWNFYLPLLNGILDKHFFAK